MNLIHCDRNCCHQLDGYCGLNHTAQLTSNAADAKCGYYQANDRQANARQEQGGREKERQIPSPSAPVSGAANSAKQGEGF